MKWLTNIGLAGTCVYLTFAVGNAASNWSDFSNLTPNEWGDLLAGIFGPLTFLWLLIGFFQQGKSLRKQGEELQHSVDALNLQAKELAASVEQQREMVKIASATLSHEKQVFEQERKKQRFASHPIFELSLQAAVLHGNKPVKFNLFINVYRATARDVQIEDTERHFGGGLMLPSKSDSDKLLLSLGSNLDKLPDELMFRLFWKLPDGQKRTSDVRLLRSDAGNNLWEGRSEEIDDI